VRGSGYLDDSIKIPSANSIMKLVGFDVYYPKSVEFVNKVTSHKFPSYPTNVPGFTGHATRSMRYPDFMVFNMVIPLERPTVLPDAVHSLWSKIKRTKAPATDKRPYVQFIVTAAIPPAVKVLLNNPLKDLKKSNPQIALFKRLLDTGGADADISSRVKLFGACSNIEKLQELGLPRPIVAFLNRYNGKPMLTKNHTLYTSHKWPRAAATIPPVAKQPSSDSGYFEVLMDVAEKGTVITQTACSQLLSKKNLCVLGLYLGLLLEGRAEDELPERQLAAAHIENLRVNHPEFDNHAGTWKKNSTLELDVE